MPTNDDRTLKAAGALVDARGYRCPIPTLRLRRALASAPPGSTTTLLSDDPMARIDVPHFAAAEGHEVLDIAADGARLRIRVRKGRRAPSAT